MPNTSNPYTIESWKDEWVLPNQNTLKEYLLELIIGYELERRLRNIPSWTSEDQIKDHLNIQSINEVEKIIKVLNFINENLSRIRKFMHSTKGLTNNNFIPLTFPSIPPQLYSIEDLSVTGMRIILSYITGLDLNSIVQVGPRNQKTAFLFKYPFSKPLVARFWNINFGQYQEMFGHSTARDYVSGNLVGLTEPFIHQSITRDFAPYSTLIPYFPIDICEKLIPLSELYLHLKGAKRIPLMEKILLSKNFNPFSHVNDRDCGLGIRIRQGLMFLTVLSFDWSDPQYYKHKDIEDIKLSLRKNPEPFLIPIDEFSWEIVEALTGN